MNKDYGQLILEDEGAQRLLKEMILEKANHYDELSEKVFDEDKINKLLSGKITFETLKKILDSEIEKDELTLLKRDLSSMCYDLNKSRNRILEDTKWAKAYEYATHVVRIDAVVANLLGLFNFGKNIACPFHQDKTPSLKIYTNNNHFVCFSCGAKGSPIDFVMKYKNCSFKDAVYYLFNL